MKFVKDFVLCNSFSGISYSKTVPWCSPMYKEGDKLCFSPCSRSVLITFTVRVTKQHPVNISFLKTLVQRII